MSQKCWSYLDAIKWGAEEFSGKWIWLVGNNGAHKFLIAALKELMSCQNTLPIHVVGCLKSEESRSLSHGIAPCYAVHSLFMAQNVHK